MFESLFEFLFKYRLLLFQEGDFSFTSPWPWAIGLIVAAALAVPSALTYTAARGDSTAADRGIMGGLRLGALSIVVFCLLQPTLIITSVVPQRNFVGILIDDSRSMTIADQDGRQRSEFVTRNFTGEESVLLDQLAERFTLRFFRFSGNTQRLGDVRELTYEGSRTEIGPALVRAQEELAGVPLSGLILITDGADNSGEALAESLLPLQATSTPVYTIGLGEEALSPDVQVSRVEGGRMFISVAGRQRFSIKEITQYRPYMAAQVELLSDESDEDIPPTEMQAIRQVVSEHVRLSLGLRGGWVREARAPADPAALSYFIAGLLPVGLQEKQSLLEEPTASRRLEAELDLLRREIEPMRRRVASGLRARYSRQ